MVLCFVGVCSQYLFVCVFCLFSIAKASLKDRPSRLSGACLHRPSVSFPDAAEQRHTETNKTLKHHFLLFSNFVFCVLSVSCSYYFYLFSLFVLIVRHCKSVFEGSTLSLVWSISCLPRPSVSFCLRS